MRKGNRIYGIIAVLLLSLGACSLIHDDMEDCQLYTPEGVPYAYVAVAFNTGMNTSTRSNPTGGEDGDGPEVGQSNENQVNDITLFFYEVGEGDACCCGGFAVGGVPVVAVVIGLNGRGR